MHFDSWLGRFDLIYTVVNIAFSQRRLFASMDDRFSLRGLSKTVISCPLSVRLYTVSGVGPPNMSAFAVLTLPNRQKGCGRELIQDGQLENP